jgi:hypothetical protein
LGLPVETFDSEINVEKQISGIENFVSSGAAVIVVCVFDPPSVQSALQEAAEAGVYLVQYAGRNAAEFGGVTISIEDEDLGRTAGEYAAQLINDEFGGEANVAILDYPDIANVVVRAEAIAAALADVERRKAQNIVPPIRAEKAVEDTSYLVQVCATLRQVIQLHLACDQVRLYMIDPETGDLIQHGLDHHHHARAVAQAPRTRPRARPRARESSREDPRGRGGSRPC